METREEFYVSAWIPSAKDMRSSSLDWLPMLRSPLVFEACDRRRFRWRMILDRVLLSPAWMVNARVRSGMFVPYGAKKGRIA